MSNDWALALQIRFVGTTIRVPIKVRFSEHKTSSGSEQFHPMPTEMNGYLIASNQSNLSYGANGNCKTTVECELISLSSRYCRCGIYVELIGMYVDSSSLQSSNSHEPNILKA